MTEPRRQRRPRPVRAVGRIRRSTFLLAVAFVGITFLWLEVRPAPAPRPVYVPAQPAAVPFVPSTTTTARPATTTTTAAPTATPSTSAPAPSSQSTTTTARPGAATSTTSISSTTSGSRSSSTTSTPTTLVP